MQQADGMKVIVLTRGDLTGMLRMVHPESATHAAMCD